MAQDDHGDSAGVESHGTELAPVSTGTAVVESDRVPNPGLPAHHSRVTDEDPKKNAAAERTVYTLFYLSLLGSILAVAFYMAVPIESGRLADIRLSNLLIGLSMTLSLFGIGLAGVHWAKAIMHDHEGMDIRHPTRSAETTRMDAVTIFHQANQESGFGRRALIRNSMIASLIAFPLPAVALLRGLAPEGKNTDPVALMKQTMWEKGTRLVLDPTGTPVKASDVTVGSVFHIIPEGLNDREDKLEQKAKAIVLLVRLNPADLVTDDNRMDWIYDGIVAYSKVCTHVGCPVALYEQQTHHLLCPCHQSQFDITRHAEVIFGPAARALPQLPITVDADGYLVAQSDFTEPVGPSFWERNS